MDDDDDYGDVLPTKFNPVIALLAPLVVFRSLSIGVAEAALLVEAAIESHLRFQHDMREFQMSASMEIESLTTDE